MAPSSSSAHDDELLAAPPTYKVVVLVLVYLLRTALMNCTYAIQTSILMDYPPKERRAGWQSLGAIVRSGWCGAAGWRRRGVHGICGGTS